MSEGEEHMQQSPLFYTLLDLHRPPVTTPAQKESPMDKARPILNLCHGNQQQFYHFSLQYRKWREVKQFEVCDGEDVFV